MKLGVLQSSYIPWLGFFDQIHQCDLFLIYEDVQFTTKDWRNRNRIKTPQGPLWLTVPVTHGSILEQKIRDVHISQDPIWQKKHWKALQKNYGTSIYFDRYASFFEQTYASPWSKLTDLNRHILDYLLWELGIHTPIIYSSDTDLEDRFQQETDQRKQNPTERILFLCQRIGADTFLEGSAGRRFIHQETLLEAGIDIQFHDYIHPEYTQNFSGFIPYLSIVDLLFNHGDNSLSILTNKT